MFRNNPDGAGFMYADGKNVYIVKGLTTLGDFNRELNKIRKKAVDVPIVMHFRITTHGGTSKGMTHPFALTDDLNTLTATRATVPCAVAHNGVIPMTSYAKKLSDTAEFVSRYMTKLLDPEHIDVDVLDVIEEVIQSKMCILTADGDVHLLGSFVQDGNGLFYSNESYKTPRKYRGSGSGFFAPVYSYNSGAFSGALYPDCNGRTNCAECADEIDCYGAYTLSNPHAFKNAWNDCDGVCEYCKKEGDCLTMWSDCNPYNPRNYHNNGGAL